MLDISCSDIFSNTLPQARKPKEKKSKQMKLHQTKSFCTVKKIIKKIKPV